MSRSVPSGLSPALGAALPVVAPASPLAVADAADQVRLHQPAGRGFLAYGIGVSLREMGDPAIALAHVPARSMRQEPR